MGGSDQIKVANFHEEIVALGPKRGWEHNRLPLRNIPRNVIPRSKLYLVFNDFEQETTLTKRVTFSCIVPVWKGPCCYELFVQLLQCQARCCLAAQCSRQWRRRSATSPVLEDLLN